LLNFKDESIQWAYLSIRFRVVMSKYILGLVIVLIPLIGLSIPDYPDSLSTPNVVVFGDSLSDSGYYDKLPESYSDWPTIDGSIKKQPTFTTPQKLPTTRLQQLANSNKINSAIPNNIGTPEYNISHKSVTGKLNGNIYAAGGATTVCAGIEGDYGSHISYIPPPVGSSSNKSCPMNRYNQIDSYLNQHDGKANSKDIYIIWAGANNAFMLLAGTDVNDKEARKKAVSGMQEAAKDVIEDVHLLQEKGARKILVLALPDLKITPAMTENGTEPNSSTAILSSKMSTAFNNVLDSSFSERNNSM
jgi:outer membrane lipase/esterase